MTTESDQNGIIRDWLVENRLTPDEQFDTGHLRLWIAGIKRHCGTTTQITAHRKI